MENPLVTGLHHVTALASDPQSNIDFYTGMMGLRLVKQTVNYDGPEVYHFFYGNGLGDPGTLITFFPYPSMSRGKKGSEQTTETAFSIPDGSMGYWLARLNEYRIPFQGPHQRFAETWVRFEDPDGLQIELIENARDKREGWENGDVPADKCILGLHSVTITEEGYEDTARLLKQQLGYEYAAQTGNRFRFSQAGKPGSIVDVICRPEAEHGVKGAGTVHHLAFGTESMDNLGKLRKNIADLGYNVTPVLARKYFNAIYFREPGNVLLEVATQGPGFCVDETPRDLGGRLQLPQSFEVQREFIEEHLPAVLVPKTS
ncbi:MAG: VOC family protein [Bacteroidota bacterium]